MSSVAATAAATATAAPDITAVPVAKKGGKKKLLLLAVPVVLAAAGAGLWFGGILPPLLGMGKPDKAAMAHPADQPAEAAALKPPTFVDLPDIIGNLNTPAKRQVFLKLKARIELAKPEDAAFVQAAMPRLLDLFQTYLREMRPEELRGSAGIWRLREELIARANVAVAPARVVDVLFTEMLIQ
jgi:flagellar FliL protein